MPLSQIYPRGESRPCSSLSSEVYFISGMSASLNSRFVLIQRKKYQNTTNMTRHWVSGDFTEGRTCVLCLAISLKHWSAHNDLQQLKVLLWKRSTPWCHWSNSSSEHIFDFLKDKRIVQKMINITILLKIFGFCLKPRIYQAFNNARFRFKPIFHFLNYPVVKSWNCTKKSWLDQLAIIFDF